MAAMDTDLQRIKELIEIMKQNGLVEIEIKHGDDKIFLKRDLGGPQTPMAGSAAGAEVATPQPADSVTAASVSEVPGSSAWQQQDLVEIKSPLVGTFYAKPSPDSDPYVDVGSEVEPQTVVCIIEAMKVMNEIKAETSGTIAEILVDNGQAVEYGQVLFRVKPD